VVVELEMVMLAALYLVDQVVVVELKETQVVHQEQPTKDLQAELTVAEAVELVVLEPMALAQMVVQDYPRLLLA
jgi:hypothetical protein